MQCIWPRTSGLQTACRCSGPPERRASGFQSAQLRQIEILMGLPDDPEALEGAIHQGVMEAGEIGRLTISGRMLSSASISRDSFCPWAKMSCILQQPSILSKPLAERASLDLVEKMGYPGVLSSHSWSTPDAYPRISELGGYIAPYAGDSTGFVDKWRYHVGRADRVGHP